MEGLLVSRNPTWKRTLDPPIQLNKLYTLCTCEKNTVDVDCVKIRKWKPDHILFCHACTFAIFL